MRKSCAVLARLVIGAGLAIVALSVPAGPLTREATAASQDVPGNASGIVNGSTPQQTSDQIGAIAQQVAQIAQDPTMSVDVKTTQINALATQFNQLVVQWQQQTLPTAVSATQPQCAPACLQTPGPVYGQPPNAANQTNGVYQLTPTPASQAPNGVYQLTPAPANQVPNGTSQFSPTPTPVVVPNPQTQPSSAANDQLRAQIANVAQQMASISSDTTLPAETKTAQLNSLSNQFNQLMVQLQQQGGG